MVSVVDGVGAVLSVAASYVVACAGLAARSTSSYADRGRSNGSVYHPDVSSLNLESRKEAVVALCQIAQSFALIVDR